LIDYAAILTKKYNAEWVLDGDDYSGLTWLSETNKPTKKQLDDLWPIVKKEIEDEKASKSADKQALLDRLGINADEAKLLIS
jgi:hypothetical protein